MSFRFLSKVTLFSVLSFTALDSTPLLAVLGDADGVGDVVEGAAGGVPSLSKSDMPKHPASAELERLTKGFTLVNWNEVCPEGGEQLENWCKAGALLCLNKSTLGDRFYPVISAIYETRVMKKSFHYRVDLLRVGMEFGSPKSVWEKNIGKIKERNEEGEICSEFNNIAETFIAQTLKDLLKGSKEELSKKFTSWAPKDGKKVANWGEDFGTFVGTLSLEEGTWEHKLCILMLYSMCRDKGCVAQSDELGEVLQFFHGVMKGKESLEVLAEQFNTLLNRQESESRPVGS